ncbi:MAG: dephospho-CoA kinase, partial [Bowdeniella nasicola]|nr:dephospho-CoA kinase [Bowdeniella nasicola]
FRDEAARARLEAITHPEIRAAARAAATRATWPPTSVAAGLIIHEIPLLAESGLAGHFPIVITVEAPREVRIERLVTSRGMSAADAKARIDAQASDADRRRIATYVVNSATTLTELQADITRLVSEIMATPER